MCHSGSIEIGLILVWHTEFVIYISNACTYSYIQLSAVITRSNIVRYYINNYINWSRISVRGWIHKRHPLPRLNGRPMGCLLWISVEKIDALITAPHCIRQIQQNSSSLWMFLFFISTEVVMDSALCGSALEASSGGRIWKQPALLKEYTLVKFTSLAFWNGNLLHLLVLYKDNNAIVSSEFGAIS